MTKFKIQNKSKIQMSNTKNKVLSFIICALALFCALCFGICHYPLYAQDNNKLVALSKQVIEAKTSEDVYLALGKLADLYFKDYKYAAFVDFLKSLETQKKTLAPFISYYTALTRYHQLKHLEEAQDWDEYFSQGNTYRDEITDGAKNAIDATKVDDALHLYSQLLLWQFHCDQQDVLSEQALSDLLNSVLEYGKIAKDTKPIKAVADKLFSYGERGKSKELYKIYTDRIITSDTKDEELKNIALGFYKEGNLELAENIYDVYVDRILKAEDKEKLIPVLIEIAKDFSYKDTGLKDLVYAEKIFKKIEELGDKGIFDQQLLYLRAFNLEKAKDYAKAKDIYNDLLVKFPENSYADEAIFKIGIINTYVLRDIKTGRTYFEKLTRKETPSPQSISSLYQLGLLSQWEGDFIKAKEYFNLLLAKAKESFIDTVGQAKERLKEIEEQKSIEYNLRTFLDVSLKEENAMFDMTKSELKASIYRLNKDQEENITASTYMPESGCLQVELQYLWSGHLGQAKPSLNEPSFNTTYTQTGTGEINLVIISSTGIIDRNIDLVDVD